MIGRKVHHEGNIRIRRRHPEIIKQYSLQCTRQNYPSLHVATKPKLAKHNTRDKQKTVYAIGEGYAFPLVARVVVGLVFEAGFAFVFEAGALVAALAALVAAALAAGFLASAFLLETFFDFIAVEVFLVVVAFLEETFGVAVFLTVDFEAAFTACFLVVVLFLDLSAMSLDVVFLGLSTVSLVVLLEFSEAGFFTTLDAVVFFGLSPVEDGFFAVAVLLLGGAGSFVVLGEPLYSLTFPDLPFGRENKSPSPLAMARLKCAVFAALGSRP